MSQLYTNSYEKFLYEQYEEYKNNFKDAVDTIEKLSKENDVLKMTIERERQLHKLEIEQIKVK